MKSASLRAEKGLIEVELSLKNGKISFLKVTGDFFIYPEEGLEELEKILIGSPVKKSELKERIERLFKEKRISSPGITIDDWANVLLKAINS